MSEPIRVDASQFSTLLRAAKDFDADLGRELRKSIRIVGKKAADESKAEVLKAPESAAHHRKIRTSRGLRRAIAAGIRLQIATPKAGEGGVRIKAGTSAVAALTGNASLARKYNAKKGWRHPVYGYDEWVEQKGRPFFGSVIAKHKPDVAQAVEEALARAADAVAERMGGAR